MMKIKKTFYIIFFVEIKFSFDVTHIHSIRSSDLHIEVVFDNVANSSSDLRREASHHAVVPLPRIRVDF